MVDRDPNCEFCDIAAGEKPETHLIWRSSTWVAFFPMDPATPGHTLIIPTEHREGLWAANKAMAREMMDVALDVGHAIESALTPDGLNLITSSGKAAEQTVFHLHLHIVPRWDDDRFGEIWPEKGVDKGTDLKVHARKIAEALNQQKENT